MYSLGNVTLSLLSCCGWHSHPFKHNTATWNRLLSNRCSQFPVHLQHVPKTVFLSRGDLLGQFTLQMFSPFVFP